MGRATRTASLLLVLFLAAASLPIRAGQPGEVVDRAGAVLRGHDESGRSIDSQLPPAPAESPAAPEQVTSPSANGGGTVQSDGSVESTATAQPQSAPLASATPAAATVPLTIDYMTLRDAYSETYRPAGTIYLLGSAGTYTLSDGSMWSSGAGSYYSYAAYLDHVEVSGDTIRYFLDQRDGLLYQQTDYDSGNHSSQGTLGVSGALVLEATRGSTTAVLRGGAEIVSNTYSNYGDDRFNFFSAVVGAVVPYQLTYRLASGTWQENTFDFSFTYTRSGGWVDFAHPLSVPLLVGLEIVGSSQVPAEADIQYYAIAHFDNDSTRGVTGLATWGVSPASLATIAAGLLSTGTPEGNEAQLEITASYGENGHTASAAKTLRLVVGSDLPDADTWPMFQGNRTHTGYVPANLEPEVFSLRWQRSLGAGRVLNPVTAADGKVFVSVGSYFGDAQPDLFALDARDGETLWSKEAGSVFSVNPPAYGHGNVYFQTGKGTGAPPPLLRAFDADTGAQVFATTFGAQWENYLAPTLFDGQVYVNGGYYGGMYAFDAFSGQQRWFVDLPQYDGWTPAVDERYAYAYLGEYAPALYVVDRITGALVFSIPDDLFDWNGWTMSLAPVLGGQGDVVVIHDGRMISFDLAGRRIGWQRKSAFSGQPSIRNGVIYAVDGSRLVAVDQRTGAELWSWTPPAGAHAKSPLVVTDTHLFVATENATHAIELLSRQAVWSYPASGHLALGNETLYIAAANGTLTAVAMPIYTPAALTGLEISGPVQILENSTTSYTAQARYDDGRVRDRTQLVQWSVAPPSLAKVDAPGEVTTGELYAPSASLTIQGVYEERGVVVQDEHGVQVAIGVPIDAFVERHLEGARVLTDEAIAKLVAARQRELAAKYVLARIAAGELEGPPGAAQSLSMLQPVLSWSNTARVTLVRTSLTLLQAIGVLDPEPQPAAGP